MSADSASDDAHWGNYLMPHWDASRGSTGTSPRGKERGGLHHTQQNHSVNNYADAAGLFRIYLPVQ